MRKLDRQFYLRDVNITAHDLIGKILVHQAPEGLASGVIIETEAYRGPDDKASHTYNNKRTSRTEIQFREGGFAYVYMIYGMHYCFNITVNEASKPEAVLVRALEPLDGLELMKARRKTQNVINLCNGPGKLCSAMGINMQTYGQDLCGEKIYILDDNIMLDVGTSPRINIDYAEEYVNMPWRYFAVENIYVSKCSRKKKELNECRKTKT